MYNCFIGSLLKGFDEMPKYRYKIFAAIDLGSTDITMKIVQVSKNDMIKVLDTVKYNISLGKEVYAAGKISYGVVEKICSCFEEYSRIMKSYDIDDYVCYATTAVREASNSEYIIDQINIRTGIKVNIISNEEECFLHNKALALENDYFDNIIEKGAVIVDVSSGSVQVSFYKMSRLQFSQSVPMGSMRVLEMLSDNKNDTVTFSGLLEDFIKSSINNYKKVFFKNPEYKYFVAVGNQNKYIKQICRTENNQITVSELDMVYETACERGADYISEKYNIPYDSAKLILPTVLFYRMFLNDEEHKDIIMPDVSLADGICIEYVEKNAYNHTKHIFTDDIISSAKYYAEKYDVSSRHYNKIVDFCTSITESLSKKFGLSKRHLVLLKVAAIFADTGYYININEYNKYSYDIVKANPILGLSQKEHEIISCTVLFQNGIFSTAEYNGYSKNRKLLISKLAAVLSLAKSLDVEYRQKIDRIKTTVKNGNIIITAYTDKDINLESREFSIAQEFFEEVFGIKAVLVRKGLK